MASDQPGPTRFSAGSRIDPYAGQYARRARGKGPGSPAFASPTSASRPCCRPCAPSGCCPTGIPTANSAPTGTRSPTPYCATPCSSPACTPGSCAPDSASSPASPRPSPHRCAPPTVPTATPSMISPARQDSPPRHHRAPLYQRTPHQNLTRLWRLRPPKALSAPRQPRSVPCLK